MVRTNGLLVSTLLFVTSIIDSQFAAMVHAGMHWTERPVPKTHAEAMTSPWASEWATAEHKERKSLKEKGVLGELQPIPSGRKVRTLRYVYKWKAPLDDGGKDLLPLTCRDFH